MVEAHWAVDNSQAATDRSADWFYGARFLEEVLFDAILAIDMGNPTFLLGAKGSGKTTLVRQAATRLRGRYHIAWLEGYPKLGLGQVTDVCRRDFDPEAWQEMATWRPGTAQIGRRPSDNLLIVEHAEAISPQFLEQLVAVSNGWEMTMPSHRILLTGDVALGSLIGVSHLHNNWGAPVVLRLPAWPDEAVAPFLRHRLSCAGATSSDLLTDAAVAHITNAAGGSPRRMLELAKGELQRSRDIGDADLDIDPSTAALPMRLSKSEPSWVVPLHEPGKSVRLQSTRWSAPATIAAVAGFVVAGVLAVLGFEQTHPRGLAPTVNSRPATAIADAAPPPSPVVPSESVAVELHPPAPAAPTEPIPGTATESEVAASRAPTPSPAPPEPEPEQTVAKAPPAALPPLRGEQEPAPTIQAPSAAPPPVADSRPVPSQSEINELIDRGNILLRAGDFAAARLFYIQAARAGSGKANTAVAWTYDPLVLDHMGVISNRGDPAKAIEWYRRALALGDEAAAEPLRRLSER
jgi:type II secretory pathway predicted ATPase ExeA